MWTGIAANKLSFYILLFTNYYLLTHNAGTNTLEETEMCKTMHHKNKYFQKVFKDYDFYV